MRRSMLFLPGNNPNMLINGNCLGADAVIFDLEDAVSPTEKDAARLRSCPLDEAIANNLYILPIEVEFLQHQQEKFNHYIIDYVSKNSRNRVVH